MKKVECQKSPLSKAFQNIKLGFFHLSNDQNKTKNIVENQLNK
jgi:hypothetical protein